MMQSGPSGARACPVLCAQVEARLRQLEGRMLAGESAKPRGKPDIAKYEPGRQGGAGAALLTAPVAYNPAADVTATAGKEEKKKVRAYRVLDLWGRGLLGVRRLRMGTVLRRFGRCSQGSRAALGPHFILSSAHHAPAT